MSQLQRHADTPPAEAGPLAATASLALREATSAHHRQAERSAFQQQLALGRVTRTAFAAWLGQMQIVYSALEAHVARAGAAALGGFQAQGWQRTPHLGVDLAHWGSAPVQHRPLTATMRLLRELESWADQEPRALLGVLYVLEGSTNGGRYLAKGLREAWQVEGAPGLSFLDPHGEAQFARWAAFKQELDRALPLSAVSGAVEAARTTFQALEAIGVELLAVGA